RGSDVVVVCAQVVMVLLALVWGAAGGGVGVPSALLLAALCMWPMSAGLMASATASAAPTSSSSTPETLGELVQRVRAGLPHLPPVQHTMDSLLDLAARSPSAAMLKAMEWMPELDDGVTSADILRSYGYEAEEHFVWTEDGYRLRLDRVAPRGPERRQPVLLAHGMQTASPSFLVLGKDKSLATMLSDAGYDVWLLNYRGTHYSMVHRNMTANEEKFWKFSFHEHGFYDNPAAIDHVLQVTGFSSVLYASHSMGSTSFMIMASTRPEYNDKILAAHLMAPAGPLHHHRSPFVGLLYAVNNVTQPMVDALHLQHTASFTYRFLRRFAAMLYSLPVPGLHQLLYGFTSTIVGHNREMDYYGLPYFWKTIPSGGSWGEIFHYEQNAKPGVQGFRQYDHGKKRNVELYGSDVPPLYELSNIRAPVHFYLGLNDILCADEDMAYLRANIRGLVGVQYAPDPGFNHMDFFAGRTAHRQVYLPMIKAMGQYAAVPASRHSDGADNALDVGQEES
ncbi:Lipase 1, partial [Frankliniella fusca]